VGSPDALAIFHESLKRYLRQRPKDALRRAHILGLLGKRNKEVEAYYIALGEFVTQFSWTEQELQVALWRAAKMKEPTAQAVLSGVRTEAAISLIYRVADAQNWPQTKRTKLKRAFDQLQVINKLRNDVLHRGSKLQTDGSWLVTNERFVHIPERIAKINLSAAELRAAADDLFKIREIISTTLWGLPKRFRSPILKILSGAWQYKPSPPGQKVKKNRRTPPKSPRPRRPSLG
jgi:hypothetical protein